MTKLKLLITDLIGLWIILRMANSKIVNCNFGAMKNHYTSDLEFQPSYIDPLLCTHLSFFKFGITPAGEVKVLNEWVNMNEGYISKAMDLKRVNPNLKVLAIVDVGSMVSGSFSKIAADTKKRRLFIKSALQFIKEHGFDGLNIYWENSDRYLFRKLEKVNFVTLLKELKAALKPLDLVLCILASALVKSARTYYDIPKIVQHVDFINLATYDFAGPSYNILRFNAPLRGQGNRNVRSAVKHWLNKGAPASKLVLGLPFYGIVFELSNPNKFTIGSRTISHTSNLHNVIGYNFICTMEKTMSPGWDSESEVPFIRTFPNFVSYDDVKSIENKVKFGNSLNLAGFHIWSLETDDFLGKCGEKYPLLKVINNNLDKKLEACKPVQPESTDGCSVDGYFAHANDCTRFYECYGGERHDTLCPPGFYFDAATRGCR